MSLNIGIFGNSGTGKSSFINAIRGLSADNEGAAAVGVTETTVEPTSYAHPNNEQLKFWDLPGVGTPKFPKEQYLKRIGFDKFDFFLIITNNRFTENDKWLADEITQQKKLLFFVRTKVDNDMENDKQCHPRTHKEEIVLDRIRKDIRTNLGSFYNKEYVFLIDNYERNLYDFEKLERRIVEEFPSIKRTLILSLRALSKWKEMPLNIGITEEQRTFLKISEEEAREYNNLYENGGAEALKAHLRKKINKWKEMSLNIGIIGNSGSGKSSFINAVRCLTADDGGAAAVGVTETTNEPIPYAHPKNELLKFWDLPGVGTPSFPKDEYLERIGFDKFDFFLIIASVRFTENDKWLAEQITQQKKKFFFIRTKIHNDIRDDKYNHPKTHSKEAVLTTIRDDIQRNLGNLYIDGNMFLIDSHKRKTYDFEVLERRIIEDFPSIKRDALILSLTALSEWMIKEKVKILQMYVWASCIASAAVELIPIPGTSLVVDREIILRQSQAYFQQLGLDEESLDHTADILSCDSNILKKLVHCSIKDLLNAEGILAFIRKHFTPALLTREESGRFIPIIGWIVSSAVSFCITYKISNLILTKMEEVALLVVQTAAEHSSNQLRDSDSEEESQ